MGRLRDDIMRDCPDGFEDRLEEFINEVESIVNIAKDKMDIDSIDHLGDIAEAAGIIVGLADDLY